MLVQALSIAGFEEEAVDSWRAAAACRDVGTDPFYSEGESFSPSDQRADPQAAKWCSRCRVPEECLEFALENNERHGVWGGLMPHQRAAFRRRTSLAERLEST